MKRTILAFSTLLTLFSYTASAQAGHVNQVGHLGGKPIEGRWDLTVDRGDKQVPSWLEVHHSGLKNLVGHFVGDGGSARPIAQVFVDGDKVNFTIPAQWEPTDQNLVFEGTLKDDALTGTIVSPMGKKWTFTGVRAPRLIPTAEPVWDKPVVLFDGKNMDKWQALGDNQWVVENGVLKSPHSGANLRTKDVFKDFKLHIEFKYPEESNSGVYLRGRYEVQVADSRGKAPAPDELGGVYGFIAPIENMSKDPGVWQTYDITLVGRLVTVVLNGKTVIFKNEIPGITGGALDSKEGEPGPIMIQGDHGPIEYRNIILTPAK
jgi:hypothetical protein